MLHIKSFQFKGISNTQFEHDSWKEFLQQDEHEEYNEEVLKLIDKLNSLRYPVFMRLEFFKSKIETIFPTIVWKQDITESFEENKFDFLYTEILTTIGLFMI